MNSINADVAQGMAAQALLTRQAIDIAVLGKVQHANNQQAQAALALLDQAVESANSPGETSSSRGHHGIDLTV